MDYVAANQVEIKEVVKGENVEGDVEAWWNDEGGANEEVPYGELTPAMQESVMQGQPMFTPSQPATQPDRPT